MPATQHSTTLALTTTYSAVPAGLVQNRGGVGVEFTFYTPNASELPPATASGVVLQQGEALKTADYAGTPYARLTGSGSARVVVAPLAA